MSVDISILQEILKKREQKRRSRETELAMRKESVCREIPRIAEILSELQRNMAYLARAIFDGSKDAEEETERIRRINKNLNAEKESLLKCAGYPAGYLNIKYDCPVCEDTGYYGAAQCACLIDECTKLQNKQLSFLLNTDKNNFDNFDFGFYSKEINPKYGMSPFENMQFILYRCRDFVDSFAKKTENFLFSGGPGIGKTFLSGCIAKEISAKGFSVVYDTAVHIFSCMEQEKFGNLTDDNRIHLKRISSCDLLIIDDLGTEMQTAFTVSAVYSLINDRIMKGLPMIISTNINESGLKNRYNPQIASRLCGEFSVFEFFGEDIRILKRRKNNI